MGAAVEPTKPRLRIRKTITVGRIVAAVEAEHLLCGEVVTDAEFKEYLKTGVMPKRILRGHTEPRPKPWE